MPKKLLVIGGGIIGLEMGTVYSTLGARLDVVEMMDGLMLGADRDLVAVWQKFNAARFDKVMLKTKTTKVEADERRAQGFLRGRRSEDLRHDPGLGRPGAERQEDRRGQGRRGRRSSAGSSQPILRCAPTCRTSLPSATSPAIRCSRTRRCTKAMSPRRRPAGMKSHFDARVIPSVAYTDPEIAWVGLTEDEAKKNGTEIGVAKFPWAASGRAIANARDEGFTKLIFDAETHRVLGGAHRRHRRRRPDQRARARGRDGRRRHRHRQDHPSAPDHQRIGRHGGRAVRRRVHRSAAADARNESGRAERTGGARSAEVCVEDAIVGVGSGSTVFKFIDALATIKAQDRRRGRRFRSQRGAAEEARHPRVRPEQRRTSCRSTSTARTRLPSTCT